MHYVSTEMYFSLKYNAYTRNVFIENKKNIRSITKSIWTTCTPRYNTCFHTLFLECTVLCLV